MEVRLFPNSMRPDTGLKPRRESQRPLLPQHARHCPVLEAGSAMGFLVYPPLEKIESFYVAYQGDGRYVLTYFLNASQAQGEPIFSVALHLPMGSIGMLREQIAFMSKQHPVSTETALALTRTFIVPEDLGTPAGGISLRDCTPEELAAIAQSKDEFFRQKAALKQTTGYGLQYSPHYLRQSRTQKT
jgi:hypothetical protein